jgi:metal-sulfur cluster biosynthetic enzyme
VSESSTGAEPTLARVLEVLREVIDPELGLNVVDLGLVYGAEVHANRVHVRLTMTTAACPLGEQIVEEADARLRALPGVSDVHVELVWDPPWRPERMSQAAKRALGWQS